LRTAGFTLLVSLLFSATALWAQSSSSADLEGLVTDSGGVQEEVPTLGKPLLILRENTERPESVEAGIARLVGGRPERLAQLLDEAWRPGSWVESAGRTENPFGRGDAGRRIADAIATALRGAFSLAEEVRP
jgi:UDP-N-acetylglucosamine 2-epimerase (non-hydrolysing)